MTQNEIPILLATRKTTLYVLFSTQLDMNLIGVKSDDTLNSDLYSPCLDSLVEGIRHSSVVTEAAEIPIPVSPIFEKREAENLDSSDDDGNRSAFENELNERRLAMEYGLLDYGQDDYDSEEGLENLENDMTRRLSDDAADQEENAEENQQDSFRCANCNADIGHDVDVVIHVLHHNEEGEITICDRCLNEYSWEGWRDADEGLADEKCTDCANRNCPTPIEV